MFYSDKPIASSKDDLLDRKNFAQLLAQSLINLKSADTFTVGLFGKWGSGKTSLVNMMLQEIEYCQEDIKDNNGLIIVHFEPWNFSDANQLLAQFFLRLSNKFRNNGDARLAKIGEALDKYSDAFEVAEAIPVVGGLLAILGKNGATALGKKLKKGSDEKDITKQKEHVMSLLEKQPNKILIIIDDIDRLSNEQIRQVFQLITSVAKFPNTIYLLVFDKEIVIKALEKVQEGSGEDYLEKIIQVPIQIPDIQKEELTKTLFNQLDLIISEHKNMHFETVRWQRLFEPCIKPYFKNLRDINRLCNALQFKLTTISSEIDFTDMIAISALELGLPKLYEWIKENKSILTGEFGLSYIGLMNKSQNEICEIYQNQILSLMQNNRSDKINELDVNTAISFLSHLFPYFGQKIGKVYETYDLDQFRRNNQIAHPDKFDRYFRLDPDCIGIKKSDILSAVQTFNGEDFSKFIMEQDKSNNSYEFLEEVRAQIPNISIERAKIIAEALIKTASKLNVISNKHSFSLSASSLAEYIVIYMIERLQPESRFGFISSITKTADSNSVQALADIINMWELGYGRLAANGTEHGYKKILTIDDLLKLESVYSQRAKEILQTTNLFDLNHWRMVCYLLECFDPKYIKTYITEALNDDNNVLKYLDSSVNTWTGSSILYEVNEEYKKYLTTERILEAIQNKIQDRTLFSLKQKTQNNCGAFFLNASGKLNNDEKVSQSDIDILLATWQE